MARVDSAQVETDDAAKAGASHSKCGRKTQTHQNQHVHDTKDLSTDFEGLSTDFINSTCPVIC